MGAPCRGERAEKYNHLIRIEEEPGSADIYAGEGAFVLTIFDHLEYTL
jgi:enolase